MTRSSSKAQQELSGQRLFVDEGGARSDDPGVRATGSRGGSGPPHRRGPYERSPQRTGHRNGTKPRTMKTAVGQLQFDVPQVRDGSFRPSVFERYQRSDRALVGAMQEMVVQGVSTRRVSAVLNEMGGFEVSATTVSRAMAELDEEIARWHGRRLDGREFPYLIIDARYEKVRQDGQVRDAAVLIAVGVDPSGHRKVLGVSISLGEQEIHWRTFLESLVQRGLRGVKLIVSDDHSGLKAARQAVFGGLPWQRCQFHLQQNAQSYIPRKDMQKEVAEDIRVVFTAPDRVTAEEYLKKTVAKYQKTASKLADWMERAIPEGLTVFSFPAGHRRLLRTTNGLERLNREIKRRTRVVSIFPSEASCQRLVSAILMEVSDEWEGGKIYLGLEGGLSS